MTRLTISQKVIVLSVVCGTLAVASGVLGYFELLGVRAGVDAATSAGLAIRNQLEADMMHDALRGDVLSSLVASRPEERQTIAADLDQHVSKFRARLPPIAPFRSPRQ